MAERPINERFAEPLSMTDPATLSGVELLQHEERMKAFREAKKGNFEPGIALGLFPPDAAADTDTT